MKLTAKQMLKLTQFHVNTHTHTHARSLIHKRKLIMAVEKRRFKLQTKIILEEKQSNKLSIKSLEKHLYNLFHFARCSCRLSTLLQDHLQAQHGVGHVVVQQFPFAVDL